MASDFSDDGWIDPEHDGASCELATDVTEPVDHRSTRDYVLRCFLNPATSTHTSFIQNLADIDGSYSDVGATVWGTKLAGGQHGVTCSATQEALTHGPLTGHQGEFIDSGDPALGDNFFQYVFRCDPSYSGSNGTSGLSGVQVAMCAPGGTGCVNLHEFADRSGSRVGDSRCVVATEDNGSWICTTADDVDLVSWAGMPPAFGEAPPGHACDEMTIDAELWLDGSGWVDRGDWTGVTVTRGTRIRLTVDVDPAATGAFELGYRFHENQAWARIGQSFSMGVSVFPRVFEVERSGDQEVTGDTFEVQCVGQGPGDPVTYWTTGYGWSSTTGTWACSELAFTFEVSTDGGSSWGAVSDPDERSLLAGHGLQYRMTADTADHYVDSSVLVEVKSLGAEWTPMLVLETVSLLPQSAVYEPPEGIAVALSDLEVRCESGGSSETVGASAGGFGVGGSDGSTSAGGCYSFGSMSLFSPSSWLKGAGEMLVCTVEIMFVPDSEVLASEWDDLEATAEEHVPVAWVVNGLQVPRDSVEGLTSSLTSNRGGSVQWFPAGSFQPMGEAPIVSWDAQVVTPSEWTVGVDGWDTYRDAGGELVWWSFGLLVLFASWRVMGGRGGDTTEDSVPAAREPAPEWAGSPHQWSDSERPFS